MTSLSFPALFPLLPHAPHTSPAHTLGHGVAALLNPIKDRFIKLAKAKGIDNPFPARRDGYSQFGISDAIDPLYDPPEAARYLGIKESTLAVWRCVGRYGIEYVKVGRRVKYRKSALDAFIESRTYSQVGRV